MNKIKYDIDLMKYMALFESITHVTPKDCVSGEPLLFVVNQGDIARSIGKNASNLRHIEGLLKRKVKIVEFNDDICAFIRNFIAPLQVAEVVKEENKIFIKDKDMKTKGIIIGRDSSNLKKLKDLVSRYFEFEDIFVR
jgi:N utilization substance protein A